MVNLKKREGQKREDQSLLAKLDREALFQVAITVATGPVVFLLLIQMVVLT